MIFRILLTFCLLISFINTSAQKKLEQCYRINKLSIEKRNQNYPYNKTAKIVFASFEDNSRKLKLFENTKLNKNGMNSFMDGEVMKIYVDSLKKDLSKYNPDLFEEKVELSENQKNELTDLIYNFGNNHKNAVMWAAKCYMPRNAILFFDDNDKLFEFVEICFECNNYRLSTKKFDLNNNCAEKLYLLKDQFAKAGIRYGIEKEF